MIELPRGITGFDIPPDLPPCDERWFRTDLWNAIRPLHGAVIDRPTSRAVAAANFATYYAELPEQTFCVLRNTIYPWVGFCEPLPLGDMTWRFLDHPSLSAALSHGGRYRVLSRAELQQDVTQPMCAGLGPAELKQLRYWQKQIGLRVGDVVFNYWD